MGDMDHFCEVIPSVLDLAWLELVPKLLQLRLRKIRQGAADTIMIGDDENQLLRGVEEMVRCYCNFQTPDFLVVWVGKKS
jgi:hypothetical protein